MAAADQRPTALFGRQRPLTPGVKVPAQLQMWIDATKRDEGDMQRQLEKFGAERRKLEGRLERELAKEARTAAWHAGGGSLLVGDEITEDLLIAIASFLPTVKDLVSLALAGPRFTAKCSRYGEENEYDSWAAAAPEVLSVVDEAGRRWVAACSEQERGWVPRRDRESWLGLMHEVERLRSLLAFGRAHVEFISLSEHGAVVSFFVTFLVAFPPILSLRSVFGLIFCQIWRR